MGLKHCNNGLTLLKSGVLDGFWGAYQSEGMGNYEEDHGSGFRLFIVRGVA